MIKQLKHITSISVPDTVFPALKSMAVWTSLFMFLYLIGSFLPEGFDWKEYFSKGLIHPVWTPWTRWVIKPLNYPLIVAITAFGIVLRTYRYSRSPLPVVFALVSLPTIWVIFMGNLDGLVLIGLMLLPWGAPLALMKPQLSAFALLAKRSSIITGAVWILISFIIWGLWPMNFFMVLTPEWKAEWIQDISLFPWGLLIAIPLLWLSRGDEDLLMAAGSFVTPHLFPYHFTLLMPALARMNRFWMVLTWFVSWMPLLANWLGPGAWHFGNLIGACVWSGVYLSKTRAGTNTVITASSS